MPYIEDESFEWTQEGIEPTTTKKTTGWELNEKPFYGTWNWLTKKISNLTKNADWLRENKANTIDVVPITRTINGTTLENNITLDYEDVGAVPTSRTINGTALDDNITLNSFDMQAQLYSELATILASSVEMTAICNNPISVDYILGSDYVLAQMLASSNSMTVFAGISSAVTAMFDTTRKYYSHVLDLVTASANASEKLCANETSATIIYATTALIQGFMGNSISAAEFLSSAKILTKMWIDNNATNQETLWNTGDFSESRGTYVSVVDGANSTKQLRFQIGDGSASANSLNGNVASATYSIDFTNISSLKFNISRGTLFNVDVGATRVYKDGVSGDITVDVSGITGVQDLKFWATFSGGGTYHPSATYSYLTNFYLE